MESDRLLPTPREMIAELDSVVLGQERAKRAISTAVYRHYIERAASRRTESPRSRGHVLLLGPTGSGKSLLVKKLAEFLSVPFATFSATAMVQAGYVGMTVEALFEALYLRSGKDKHQAERTIVFIDEIDKVRRQNHAGPDVGGEGVQNALLTAMDGRKVSAGREQTVEIDSSGMLFVCAGAFAGLREIVAKRLAEERGESYDPRQSRFTIDDCFAMAEPDDLIAYGLIPEFLGRFSTVTSLNSLSVDDLVHILTDLPNSAVEEARDYYALHGVDLHFTPDALRAIAEQAYGMGTGARALERITRQCLQDVEHEVPSLAEEGISKVVVTELTIRAGIAPIRERSARPKAATLRRIRDLRKVAVNSTSRQAISASDGTGRMEMTEAQRHGRLHILRHKLGYEKAAPDARALWDNLQQGVGNDLQRLIQFGQGLQARGLSLQEAADLVKNCEGGSPETLIAYLDYRRALNVERLYQSQFDYAEEYDPWEDE